MAKVIGCIGCGNMGGALLAGLVKAFPGNEFNFCCHDQCTEKTDALANLGITNMNNCQKVAQGADIIILAVKPADMGVVLDEIASAMTAEKTIISIAAAYNLARLRNHLGQKPSLCRVMPTTTAKVGKGVFAICFDPLTNSPQQKKVVEDIFSKLGLCIELAESKFSAFSAFMGAGPAYIFEMLAALSQAGLTVGFPKQKCRNMLIELISGCADLAAQENASFTDLRDNVCSPAGLTIAGVNRMAKAGFTGIVVDAVEAAEKRAREMEN